MCNVFDRTLKIESLEVDIKGLENQLYTFFRDPFSRPSDTAYLLTLRERKIRECSSLYCKVSKRCN